MFALDDVEPADAGADVTPTRSAFSGVIFRPDIFNASSAAAMRQVDEASHLLDFFFFDEVERVEVLDLGGDLAGEIAAVEAE
jgi:hypothetical protein